VNFSVKHQGRGIPQDFDYWWVEVESRELKLQLELLQLHQVCIPHEVHVGLALEVLLPENSVLALHPVLIDLTM
jgi:hypothetical protein